MAERKRLVPTWRAAMQICIAAMEDGTEEGRKLARAELMELADKVDTIGATINSADTALRAAIVGFEHDAAEGADHSTGGGDEFAGYAAALTALLAYSDVEREKGA